MHVPGGAYALAMTSQPLGPRTRLSVELSAICSRNRYTDDPDQVIAELIATAGEHTDLLAEEAGAWAGFYESQHTRVLSDALAAFPGAAEWVELGRQRRDAGSHSTSEYQ